MAIKLKVQETKVKFHIQDADAARFTVGESTPIYPDTYTGSYTVTPSQSTQILETDHLMMAHNVTINPIPSNYGLITYNGSILTVS